MENISAWISTIGAVITILFTCINYNKEAPYFAIIDQPTMVIDNKGYRFEAPLKNVGGRAATFMEHTISFYNLNDYSLLYSKHSTIANPIGPEQPTVKFDSGSPDVLNRVSDRMIFVVKISYKDHSYSFIPWYKKQVFYLVRDMAEINLRHATKAQAELLRRGARI